MKTLLLAGVACLSLGAGAALAQAQTETTVVTDHGKAGGTAGGAAAGAIGGAVVGGPVGAVVGGAAGAVVGHTVAPPSEVRTYVTSQTPAPVTYSHEIVVGQPITGEITWLEVPRYPKYRWAYLNGERVVIDADSHDVVAIYR